MEDRIKGDYKIAVVANNEAVLGFKIAGVRDARTVETQEEAESVVKDILEKKDVGVVIITSNISRMIKDRRLHNAIQSSLLPMFVEVPEYNEEFKPDTLRALVMRALGIDINRIG